ASSHISYHLDSHTLLYTLSLHDALPIYRLEWDDVPSKILIYPEDYPKIPRAKPRFIDEFVLEQLNSHLDKLPEYIATMTMIVQECGMRISELCTLKKGCLLEDKDG